MQTLWSTVHCDTTCSCSSIMMYVVKALTKLARNVCTAVVTAFTFPTIAIVPTGLAYIIQLSDSPECLHRLKRNSFGQSWLSASCRSLLIVHSWRMSWAAKLVLDRYLISVCDSTHPVSHQKMFAKPTIHFVGTATWQRHAISAFLAFLSWAVVFACTIWRHYLVLDSTLCLHCVQITWW